jgi:DNA (cytosine-5)-methyltransferase 1
MEEYMNYFSMFSGIGGFELGIQRACDKRSNAPSEPSEFNSDLLQVRQRKTISTLPRNDSRVGATGEEQRSLLSTDIGGFGAVCVGYSEIDPYAIKVYERHFEHYNYGNATTINAADLPDFDLLVGGFPCQAFSIAGKRHGFNDTRGTLFFDIARILAEKRPRHLVLENVKGLLSHDSGKTFQTILGVLSDLGYRVEWQVLNSKDFGVPQNRERIYIIGHLRGECGGQVLPIRQNGEVSPERQRQVSPTITQRYYKQGQSDPYVFNESTTRIRRLTPLECERLQGFPDNWTEGESDTQRYKMCGNAVTVNVVEAVMERLLAHKNIN